jgi:hypothetical protein
MTHGTGEGTELERLRRNFAELCSQGKRLGRVPFDAKGFVSKIEDEENAPQ